MINGPAPDGGQAAASARWSAPCSLRSSTHRLRSGERLDVLAHVVRAQDRRAAVEGRDCGTDRCRHRAHLRLPVAEDAREGALAREADEERPADCEQLVQAANELEVLLDRLAEADPRIA